MKRPLPYAQKKWQISMGDEEAVGIQAGNEVGTCVVEELLPVEVHLLA